jgi:hypothetical protein
MKLFRMVVCVTAIVLAPLLLTEWRPSPALAEKPTGQLPSGATVTSRATTEHGQAVGEVLVGQQVVLRVRMTSGGYTPAQRAAIVAARLAAGIQQGYNWRDVVVSQQQGDAALLMGTHLLITANAGEALLNHSSPMELAYEWQGSTQLALQHANIGPTLSRPDTGLTTADLTSAMTAVPIQDNQAQDRHNHDNDQYTQGQNPWPDWSRTSTKIVPVVEFGSPGVSVGAAQVTGPADRVDRVRAVLELDLIFQRLARVRVFIPSSNLTGVNRVQGVAVSALLQYRLFKF